MGSISWPVRLAGINLLVFALLKITWMLLPTHLVSMESIVGALALPDTAGALLLRPWTLCTYMFTHIDFWHLLVNSLWLVWFGGLMCDIAGTRRFLQSFVLGGFGGAACYLLMAHTPFGAHDGAEAMASCLLGSSAATMGVVAATMVTAPRRRVEFPLIGSITLHRMAAIGLVLFLCASMEMAPTQNAAHLGGIVAGVAAALVWRYRYRRHARTMKRHIRYRFERMELVEKARTSGYASLSHAERVKLFDLSRHSESKLRKNS